jgi:hypothetical protein
MRFLRFPLLAMTGALVVSGAVFVSGLAAPAALASPPADTAAAPSDATVRVTTITVEHLDTAHRLL